MFPLKPTSHPGASSPGLVFKVPPESDRPRLLTAPSASPHTHGGRPPSCSHGPHTCPSVLFPTNVLSHRPRPSTAQCLPPLPLRMTSVAQETNRGTLFSAVSSYSPSSPNGTQTFCCFLNSKIILPERTVADISRSSSFLESSCEPKLCSASGIQRDLSVNYALLLGSTKKLLPTPGLQYGLTNS